MLLLPDPGRHDPGHDRCRAHPEHLPQFCRPDDPPPPGGGQDVQQRAALHRQQACPPPGPAHGRGLRPGDQAAGGHPARLRPAQQRPDGPPAVPAADGSHLPGYVYKNGRFPGKQPACRRIPAPDAPPLPGGRAHGGHRPEIRRGHRAGAPAARHRSPAAPGHRPDARFTGPDGLSKGIACFSRRFLVYCGLTALAAMKYTQKGSDAHVGGAKRILSNLSPGLLWSPPG